MQFFALAVNVLTAEMSYDSEDLVGQSFQLACAYRNLPPVRQHQFESQGINETRVVTPRFVVNNFYGVCEIESVEQVREYPELGHMRGKLRPEWW